MREVYQNLGYLPKILPTSYRTTSRKDTVIEVSDTAVCIEVVHRIGWKSVLALCGVVFMDLLGDHSENVLI
jgi:hypothetical protein